MIDIDGVNSSDPSKLEQAVEAAIQYQAADRGIVEKAVRRATTVRPGKSIDDLLIRCSHIRDRRAEQATLRRSSQNIEAAGNPRIPIGNQIGAAGNQTAVIQEIGGRD